MPLGIHTDGLRPWLTQNPPMNAGRTNTNVSFEETDCWLPWRAVLEVASLVVGLSLGAGSGRHFACAIDDAFTRGHRFRPETHCNQRNSEAKKRTGAGK
jgi:hypothetical protein